MSVISVVYVRIDQLLVAPRNARRHSKKQIKKLARAIKELGFRVPILIDRDGRIIAGHARVEAAKLLGMTEVPAITVDDLTPEKIRLLALSDNKISDLSGWDLDALAAELAELDQLDLGCDLTLSAFDTGEIDVLLAQYGDERSSEPMVPLEALSPPLNPVSRIGDLWIVGPHRLACGDAREPSVYELLLGGAYAQMSFVDPPYNVPIAGHVSGKGTAVHREFAMASGEMSTGEFIRFLRALLRQIARSCSDGAVVFVCMDHRHLRELLESADGILDYLNLCVWVKHQPGMGSLYRSQHELVVAFKSGRSPHINNIELGQHGRHRSNVWRYAGANSFGKGRDAALAGHPTTKPVAMVADAILDCSERGGIILDACAGSGTTLLAAEQTGRRGYGIEIDPAYVDLAVERLSLLAKAPIIHAASGRTFEEVRVSRAPSQEPEQ